MVLVSSPTNLGGDKTECFTTTKEAAEKWNFSVHQVQNHYKSKRIKNVLRIGSNDLMPEDDIESTCAYVDESVDYATG